MNNQVGVMAGVGLDQKTRKSHWPARLDLVQSASGLFLGLFMWGHMAFVSSILISKDAMWWITKMFEGQFVFGRPYPAIVSCVVGVVSVMFVLHAVLAIWHPRSSRMRTWRPEGLAATVGDIDIQACCEGGLCG
jgi:succinate dehydrogenase/fumarate reductase cytochrome b subunit